MTIAPTGTTDKPCSSIAEVDARWSKLPRMKLSQAKFLRQLFRKNKTSRVLELGFSHGKRTAFMAAILEEMGAGEIVTVDTEAARSRTPNIDEVVGSLGLSQRVKPIYAPRSLTWELCKVLETTPRSRFDFCYIDAAHTWDGTGFAFLLADVLLKPGGWIVLDELDWSIAASKRAAQNPKAYNGYSEDEKQAKGVRKVWELLVPARRYINVHEETRFAWGVAQKPLPRAKGA